MKKQKNPSSTKQAPIQLLANKKSQSINHKHQQQPLFSPHKIEWKNPSNDFSSVVNNPIPLKQPLRNIQNGHSETNSRNFYQNMKNELMNMKQDVEKLIMKEKSNSTQTDESTSKGFKNQTHENQQTKGCIKTVSIKNKCQQKITKIESLYENVNKILTNKKTDQNFLSPTFTSASSNIDQSSTLNLRDRLNRQVEPQGNFGSEKNQFSRSKSRSIADIHHRVPDANRKKLIYFQEEDTKDKNEAINQIKVNQPKLCEDPSIELMKPIELSKQKQVPEQKNQDEVKQKIEVDILLPSFEKSRSEEKKLEEQNLTIKKLRQQLNELSTQLTLRDELMSRKEHQKFQLIEENQKIKNQLQSQLQKHQSQIAQYNQALFQCEDKIRLLECQLQQSVNSIHNKQHENFNLIERINSQNSTIEQLTNSCQHLCSQVKSMKQSLEQSKNIKEKLKLKENQLYIYQEELKQVKTKLKEFRQHQNFDANSQRKNQSQRQSAQSQEHVLEELQRINSQLKDSLKVNEAHKSQNERLKAQISSFQQNSFQNKNKLTEALNQNLELRQKICQLQKQSQKNIDELLNNQGFQKIGEEISKKLSKMVDENYFLKNKISHLESALEQTTLRNRSLAQEVSLYEQKLIFQKDCTRRLKIQDWDNLTDERDSLKIELQKVQARLEEAKQYYELETIKRENKICELKEQINEMVDKESESEESFHRNIYSIKHIKNLDSLLEGFKEMIDMNLAMKKQIDGVQCPNQ